MYNQSKEKNMNNLIREKEIVTRLNTVIVAAATTLKMHCFSCGTRYKTKSSNSYWHMCPSCGRSIK